MKMTLTALALLLFAGCGKFGSRAEVHSEKPILAGAYTQQRPLNDDDKALFRAAIAEIDGVGYHPETVATQVVAGTNYRFICTAKPSTLHPKEYKAEVTVFQPLPGRGDPKVTGVKRL